MYARLVVVAGPDLGKAFEVDARVPQIIGSSRDADLRLNDPKVGHFHCRLQVRTEVLFATDLDAGGIMVNHVAVRENPLVYGDALSLGDTTLLVQDPDASLRETGSSRLNAKLPPPPPAPMRAVPVPEEPKEASGVTERPEQLAGKPFGPFQVGKLLWRGRNSTIFRAHHTPSNKTVALKVLPASYGADEARRMRFTKAIKAVMPLRNVNVVTTIGGGKSGPYCWTALELIDGESLTQTIRHIGVAGTLDWRRALRMSIHLARGLNYLHENNLVYRNIGPQNIMVDTETRTPRYSDFLRVRPFYDQLEPGSNDSEELSDALLLYMAPEQTREQTEVDPRTDIFNLGALLYSLLTGHAPFEGGSLAETITKIRRERPEVLKKYQLAIPEAFQGVVLQMLAKRPEDRYQSVAELLRDLERVLKYQGMTMDSGGH
ncbi:MAG: protein kinase domain-containing protein [Gemmataceae bacterium]